MYIPKPFEVNDPIAIHELMNAYRLGTWINSIASELNVNHIPFVFEPSNKAESKDCGVLRGHVSKANPIWRQIAENSETLVVFQGPQSYVSPSWYPSKLEHGKVVPTWNYMVVHAHGVQRVIGDKDWILQQLNQLTDAQEHKQQQPWSVGDAPDEYINRLLNSIVGVEITITKLDAAWKVSQNKSAADHQGVIEGLKRLGGENALKMADAIKQEGPF